MERYITQESNLFCFSGYMNYWIRILVREEVLCSNYWLRVCMSKDIFRLCEGSRFMQILFWWWCVILWEFISFRIVVLWKRKCLFILYLRNLLLYVYFLYSFLDSSCLSLAQHIWCVYFERRWQTSKSRCY